MRSDASSRGGSSELARPWRFLATDLDQDRSYDTNSAAVTAECHFPQVRWLGPPGTHPWPIFEKEVVGAAGIGLSLVICSLINMAWLPEICAFDLTARAQVPLESNPDMLNDFASKVGVLFWVCVFAVFRFSTKS